jgi:hypothetical protein
MAQPHIRRKTVKMHEYIKLLAMGNPFSKGR